MPMPSLRLFILPLGAVSMVASLASHSIPQAAERGSMIQQVRYETLACTPSTGVRDCGPGATFAR